MSGWNGEGNKRILWDFVTLKFLGQGLPGLVGMGKAQDNFMGLCDFGIIGTGIGNSVWNRISTRESYGTL